MTSTPHPARPAAGADPQPDPRDLASVVAAAELFMLDVLDVPSALLPSELEGNPLQAVAVGLRRAVLRRMRIADRLKVAAETLAGQALAAVDMAGARLLGRHTPACPVSPADASKVTELHASLAELDLIVMDAAATLRAAAREYTRVHGCEWAMADALPGVENRAAHNGIGLNQ